MRHTIVPVPGSSGLQLTVHFADEPRAVLLLVHGFGEHAGRYGRTIRFLSDRGVSVATYDLRGHGSAPGPRARVAIETHISDNLVVRDALVEWCRSEAGEGLESLPRC